MLDEAMERRRRAEAAAQAPSSRELFIGKVKPLVDELAAEFAAAAGEAGAPQTIPDPTRLGQPDEPYWSVKARYTAGDGWREALFLVLSDGTYTGAVEGLQRWDIQTDLTEDERSDLRESFVARLTELISR